MSASSTPQPTDRATTAVPLNPANAITYQGVCDLLMALFRLDAAGATVLEVRLGGRNPRIRIDAGTAFIRGAVRTRITERGQRRAVMATRVAGCQVEWEERAREPTPHAA
jgi:hypothetical protein